MQVNLKPWAKALGMALGLASTQAAWAEDWWMLAQTGAKPQRQSFYADLRSLRPAVDLQALQAGQLVRVHQIDTRLVNEAAAPNSEVARTFLIDCDKARAALARGAEIGRDGVALAELPRAWERVGPGSPMEPLHGFVCEALGKISAAGKPPRDVRATASAPPFAHAWTQLWPDAKAPDAQSPTPQREAQARQRQEQLQAHLRQQDAQYVKGGNAAAYDKAATAAKQNRSVLPDHESWIGETEAELVSEMGPPDDFVVRGGVRSFVYSSSYERTSAFSYWGWYGRTIVIAPETLWCKTTYRSTQGRVFDYSVDGNDCN